MKRFVAVAVGVAVVAGGGVAVASPGGQVPTRIHLVNVAHLPSGDFRAVKAAVRHAYRHNAQPIVFGMSGNKVYLERPAQRVADGTYFNGSVYCFHSDVGPDPDATVTSTARVQGDAAGVALAVAEIQRARCAPGP